MSLATDLAAVHDGHIRLAILRLLDDQANYCANDSVLHDAVNALGLACTRDQVRGHIAWLQEQRLVTTLEPAPGLIVATLTEGGGDVAKGRSIRKGIARPSPRA